MRRAPGQGLSSIADEGERAGRAWLCTPWLTPGPMRRSSSSGLTPHSLPSRDGLTRPHPKLPRISNAYSSEAARQRNIASRCHQAGIQQPPGVQASIVIFCQWEEQDSTHVGRRVASGVGPGPRQQCGPAENNSQATSSGLGEVRRQMCLLRAESISPTHDRPCSQRWRGAPSLARGSPRAKAGRARGVPGV